MKTILLTCSMSLILLLPAGATLVTFDDINPADLTRSYGQIPNGYAGFGWDNVGAVLTGVYGVSQTGCAAIHLGGAFNNQGHFGTFGTPFTLNSAYLTSEYNGVLQVEVRGSNRGQTLYDTIYTLSYGQPTLCLFNYAGIDTVYISAPAGMYQGGAVFQMDNLLVNAAIPEPATVLAGALLLLPLGVSALRKLLLQRCN